MRLLSFLADIEKALLAESPAIDGGAWNSLRMVNFNQGLARLTLTPREGNEFTAGSIFLQGFLLADGAQCLKANLSWNGTESCSVMPVYSTPQLNWKLEASRIASRWLEGPGESATITSISSGVSGYSSAAGTEADLDSETRIANQA